MSKVEDEESAFDHKKRLWISSESDVFRMVVIQSSKGDSVTVKDEQTGEVGLFVSDCV